MFEIRDGELYYKESCPKTTEEAWRITLAKWEFVKVHQAEIGDCRGANTCGLCLRFYNGYCQLCPIAQYTGKKQCDDTPYRDLISFWLLSSAPAETVQAEIDFLEKVYEKWLKEKS